MKRMLFVLVCVLLIAGCSEEVTQPVPTQEQVDQPTEQDPVQDDTPQEPAQENTTEEPTQEPAQEPVQEQPTTVTPKAKIRINGFYPEPRELTIATGTTVTWVNLHPNFEHIIGINKVPMPREGIDYNETVSWQFNDSGTYQWQSRSWPETQGVIVVN